MKCLHFKDKEGKYHLLRVTDKQAKALELFYKVYYITKRTWKIMSRSGLYN